MTGKQLLAIICGSVVTAFVVQWLSVQSLHSKINEHTAIACEMVSARAQAGSTRDVHDQLYAFWRKHSPTASVDVLVKHGEKEIRSQTSVQRKNNYIQNCYIENKPDYEIAFQFEDKKVISLSLIEKFAMAFIVFFIFTIGLKLFIRSLREMWSHQVLHEVRQSLGLESKPSENSTFVSRFLAKIFLNSASSLKPAITSLQEALMEKSFELTKTKDLISKLELEKDQSNHFSNMVTMVRHDLKGPLSSLKITASEISHFPEEAASLRQTIGSIEKIISDLDQKKYNVRPTLTEILTLEIAEAAIQEIVDEKSGALANQAGIQIDFEFNKNVLSPVKVDPNHLRRMVANLIQNAIEASPNFSIISLGVRHDKGDVLIEIADQGSGIAPEILPRLFEKGATFGKNNGTGEGLAFVKSRAESFGGAISVVETSTAGTIFQLRLPLVVTKARFQAFPSEEACKQLAILDDEIEFQKFAWSKMPGHREYFSSPQAFLNWVETSPEAANFSYLTDLHLRNIVNGIDVIRALGDRKVIYLTTSDYLNTEAIDLSERLGIAIIPKPLLFSICAREIESI